MDKSVRGGGLSHDSLQARDIIITIIKSTIICLLLSYFCLKDEAAAGNWTHVRLVANNTLYSIDLHWYTNLIEDLINLRVR